MSKVMVMLARHTAALGILIILGLSLLTTPFAAALPLSQPRPEKVTMKTPLPTISRVAPIGNLASSPWPMFRHDAQHTGRSQYLGAQTGQLRWKFKTDGHVDSSPAIGLDGTVYVGSGDGYFYAINPDGSLKWKLETGQYGGWSDLPDSSPAIDANGAVYVGGYDGSLYAINPDGSLKWKLKLTEVAAGSSPVIGSDGTIYMNTGWGDLYAVNSLDGSVKWKFDIRVRPYLPTLGIPSSPAIGFDDTIYVADSGYLFAIGPDGSGKWASDVASATSTPAISAEDRAIYTTRYDALYAVNLDDGSLKWVSAKLSGVLLNLFSGPAIGSDGTVYVHSEWSHLYAVNPDGSLKWNFTLGGWKAGVGSSPTIGADDTIYVGGGDYASGSGLYAINRDGSLKWKFKVEGSIDSSPAIASDGTIYVGGEDGYLYAIGGSSGPSVPKFLTLPFVEADIKVQQGWTEHVARGTRGVDYVKGQIGDSSSWQSFDVVAAAEGEAFWNENESWGKYVYVRHETRAPGGSNYHTLYAHLESVVANIPKEGGGTYKIGRGELIGQAGDTGSSGLTHLHFEVHIGDARARERASNRIDPYDLNKTREFYYPGGGRFAGCGPNHLWTTEPPSLPLGMVILSVLVFPEDLEQRPNIITPAVGEHPYPVGARASLSASESVDNLVFLGWWLDGVARSMTPEFEVDMGVQHKVAAVYVEPSAFRSILESIKRKVDDYEGLAREIIEKAKRLGANEHFIEIVFDLDLRALGVIEDYKGWDLFAKDGEYFSGKASHFLSYTLDVTRLATDLSECASSRWEVCDYSKLNDDVIEIVNTTFVILAEETIAWVVCGAALALPIVGPGAAIACAVITAGFSARIQQLKWHDKNVFELLEDGVRWAVDKIAKGICRFIGWIRRKVVCYGVFSDAKLLLIDSQGRRVGGGLENGQWITHSEIPGAWYSSLDSRPQYVMIAEPQASTTYRLIVTGNEEGEFHLNATNVVDGDPISVQTYTGTIRQGETQEYTSELTPEGQIIVRPTTATTISQLSSPLLFVILIAIVVVGISALMFRRRRVKRPGVPASAAPALPVVTCSRCGTRLPQDAVFCDSCGVKVIRSEDEQCSFRAR